MTTHLTFEEKIDAIYTMLRANESRLRRAFWYRIFKWCILLSIGYTVLTHPGYVIGKMTEYIQPIVIEQMQSIIANQKSGFIDQVKKMMPEQNIQ